MLSLTLFYRKGLPFLNEHGLFVISIYTNYFTLSYVMKKTGILFTFLCLFIFASCSNSNTEEEAEGANSDEQNVIEVEIEDASYILSGQDDGEAAEDGGLLYIDLQVENISDNSIQISPEQDIQLYDGDNQIDPSNDAYPALGL